MIYRDSPAEVRLGMSALWMACLVAPIAGCTTSAALRRLAVEDDSASSTDSGIASSSNDEPQASQRTTPEDSGVRPSLEPTAPEDAVETREIEAGTTGIPVQDGDADAASTFDGPSVPRDAGTEPLDSGTEVSSGQEGMEQPPTGVVDAGTGEQLDAARDVEPPTIVSVAPLDGSVGVASDTSIVVRFSESMDTARVRDAFYSDDIDASNATYQWSDSGRVLTIVLSEPLQYAAGSDPEALVPLSYHWGFSPTATDLAGNPLPAVSFSFSTLRELTHTIAATNDFGLTGSWTSDGTGGVGATCDEASGNVCVGDGAIARNAQYKGFFTFDLDPLVADVPIQSASLYLPVATILSSPFESLGELQIEQLAFAQIDDNAFEASGQDTLGAFMQAPESGFTADVTDAVAFQAQSGPLAQYRLSFAVGTDDDGRADILALDAAGSQLVIRQLAP